MSVRFLLSNTSACVNVFYLPFISQVQLQGTGIIRWVGTTFPLGMMGQCSMLSRSLFRSLCLAAALPFSALRVLCQPSMMMACVLQPLQSPAQHQCQTWQLSCRPRLLTPACQPALPMLP